MRYCKETNGQGEEDHEVDQASHGGKKHLHESTKLLKYSQEVEDLYHHLYEQNLTQDHLCKRLL